MTFHPRLPRFRPPQGKLVPPGARPGPLPAAAARDRAPGPPQRTAGGAAAAAPGPQSEPGAEVGESAARRAHPKRGECRGLRRMMLHRLPQEASACFRRPKAVPGGAAHVLDKAPPDDMRGPHAAHLRQSLSAACPRCAARVKGREGKVAGLATSIATISRQVGVPCSRSSPVSHAAARWSAPIVTLRASSEPRAALLLPATRAVWADSA